MKVKILKEKWAKEEKAIANLDADMESDEDPRDQELRKFAVERELGINQENNES